VLRQALELTVLGVVLGLGGAFALSRVMEALLFNVGVRDAVTFTAVR
jgi:hypothetical protein